MKDLKRFRYIVLAALLIAAAVLVFFILPKASTPSAFQGNLLKNGDFSLVDDKGIPEGWYLDAYAGLDGAEFDVVETAQGSAAHITNVIPKDARFAQTVSVSPNSLYRLHGYIKADADGGKGANLSVEDVYVFSDCVYDSKGEWQEVTLYGRTGEKQRSVNVFVRLGGYSGEALGEAFFRDITLTKVDQVESGFAAENWYRESYASSDASSAKKQSTASTLLVFLSAAYFIFFVFLCLFLRKPRRDLQKKPVANAWIAALFLLIAAAFRIFIAWKVKGYDVDIGCFRAWGNRMAENGPAAFYPPEDPFSSCDYPPGYMWILWVLGLFGKLLGTDTTQFMVKLPSVAADVALCALLYSWAIRKRNSAPSALALSLLYAFNPLVIVSGAAWGQADAVMTLLLILTVYFAVDKKWKAALPLYMAAVLCKPQALMFGPLGLAALICQLVHEWKNEGARKALIKDSLLGLVFTLLVYLAITLPFSIHQKWDWLITLYGKTMGRYDYATVNNCNIYFLLGKNWVSCDKSLTGDAITPILVASLAVLPLIFSSVSRAPIFKGKLGEKPDRIRLFVLGGLAGMLCISLLILYFTGSLTYSALGSAMILYCLTVVCFLYILGNDIRNLPVFGAILLLALCGMGTMMHERYLFPAAGLLLLGYLLKKDTRILWLAVGVAIAGFLNVGCVLDRNIRIGGAAGHLDAPAYSTKSDMAIVEYFSAFLNTAVCFYSLCLCSVLSRGEASIEFSENNRPATPTTQEVRSPRMKKADWIIMLSVTLLYAVLAFVNLGSAKAPQTAFVSNSADEEVVLDLGDVHDFHMLFYGGIHQYDCTFSVDFSDDGETWRDGYDGKVEDGDCFRWKFLAASPSGSDPVDLHARYIRLTANHYHLTLHELLFKDLETGQPIRAQLVSDKVPAYSDESDGPIPYQYLDNGNETALFLVDEPDSMEGDYPSWYNSTYFDEIYHARTGYEHLHGMQPYETTHPPLGKVFISWAIALFGMTPFGWRFAGALAGVLMLPGMYLLGKLLIKRFWGGLGAMLLMAFDLMHFTQTRIATIDSFAVLFIIWMVYCMLRWFYQDYFHMPLWKSLIPLSFSGLFMGLGVASKWTACYAGVVLAVIFFFGIWRRWQYIRETKKALIEKNKKSAQADLSKRGKGLIITIASCLVFFILVPMIIYYCSYIPYFAYDGLGVTPKKIIEAAVGQYFTNGTMGGMLGYHSEPGRGMDHYFYSPWYQWPVIGKPMWYSSNGFEPSGMQMSIMAMGNPAVWWLGLICIVICLILWVGRHMRGDRSLSLYTKTPDSRFAHILLCYFGQLMPWILVPRGTYIYHYFPCVPFIILATVLCIDVLADYMAAVRPEKASNGEENFRKHPNPDKISWVILGVILFLSLSLFIAFFPYASGVMVSEEWLEAMKWFPRWLWY